MEENKLCKEEVKKIKDKERKNRNRQNLEFKRKENYRKRVLNANKREDKEWAKKEQQRKADSMKMSRLNIKQREQEQKRNTELRRQARLNEEKLAKEQKQNTEARRIARTNLKRRDVERTDDRIAKKLKRCDLNDKITFEDLCAQYESNIKQGPTVICKSCFGLFFESSIRTVSINALLNYGIILEFLQAICNTADKMKFCRSCHRDIINNKFPTLSKVNGFCFPVIPDILHIMTEVESRLVSPRIPFMQIRELSKRDRQYAIKGNVVNVPVSVDTSVRILPRSFDNSHTIQLKLKRKMCYQSHYLYETIRPSVCYKAVLFLMKTPLYQLENIKMSENWLNQHPNQNEDFIILDEDKYICSEKCDDENLPLTSEAIKIEEMIETEEEMNVTNTDTLWSDKDDTQTIEFAPGEGIFPISLLRDEFAEELSFSTIYCGEPRTTNKNVSYANICEWELRHFDRRCCNVANIFFKFKKRQLQMMTKQVSLHLRKRKNSDKITAGQLLDKEFVDNICKVVDGYKFLKVDRASPPYWQSRKKEVLAMIRQLGIPTLFFTLSAAETRWKELLVILMKTVRNKIISEEETNNLDYKDKCELISKDPVTCSRYFDNRIRELFHVLQHLRGPFSDHPISDTYVRVEFQHRGSPHVHCLLWLKNAPLYDTNQISIDNCVEFIDNYITNNCECDDSIVQLQTHSHSKSCLKFKGDKVICRFGFPQLPMPTTLILEPIECDDYDKYEKIYNNIQQTLRELEKRQKNRQLNLADLTFDNFLQQLNITHEDYVYTIQTQLKNPKVFLKREVKNIRVNGYNENILKLHRANIDIQFILDPYSCVQYILNYLNKADRGMSKLLREAAEEFKAGNFSIRDRLRIIGDSYLKATEISAQEAVYHLLSMNLSRCSRSHVFINTGEPTERNKMVISEKDLKEMNSESHDVFQKGDLDYYPLRNESMQNTCLADFCANYNRYLKKPKKKTKLVVNENEDIFDEEDEIGEILSLKENLGYLEKRRKPKIIRFKRYNFKNDEYNNYREQCQLFVPWLNETDDVGLIATIY